MTYCRGEESAGLELLQSHGAGVGPKEQDEGHEGDVRHVVASVSNQKPSANLALLLSQQRPAGVLRLQTRGARKSRMRSNKKASAQLILFYQDKNTTYQLGTVCPRGNIKEFWRVAWWKETMISNQYKKKTSDSSGFTVTLLNMSTFPCRTRAKLSSHTDWLLRK